MPHTPRPRGALVHRAPAHRAPAHRATRGYADGGPAAACRAVIAAGATAASLALGAPRAAAQRPATPPPAAAPGAPPDTAAAHAPPPRGAARRWAVSPFVGYAARSPVRFWGLTPGRNHLMLGAELARTVWSAGALAVAYAPNVVPVFVLTNNPRGPAPPGAFPPAAVLPACESARCAPTVGVAVAPAGLRVELRAHPALAVYGAAAAGLVRFGRNVPVAEARRLNVTAEWGGGVVAGRGRVGLQVGYKYHHLSNAYTAARNPGVDGRVVHAGLRWLARR